MFIRDTLGIRHFLSLAAGLLLVGLFAAGCTLVTEIGAEPSLSFPTELERALDREACPDYCWHGVMLGQTEEEAIAAIRADPDTRKDIDFGGGDYIRIERFQDGAANVMWDWQDLDDSEARLHRGNALRVGVPGEVEFLLITLEDMIPLSVLVERIGPPERYTLMGEDEDVKRVLFCYPALRLDVILLTRDETLDFEGENYVEAVAFTTPLRAAADSCVAEYVR
jgi:hypothetical protein